MDKRTKWTNCWTDKAYKLKDSVSKLKPEILTDAQTERHTDKQNDSQTDIQINLRTKQLTEFVSDTWEGKNQRIPQTDRLGGNSWRDL